jgi:Trypsin
LKRRLTAIAVLTLILALAVPAGAITRGGNLDGQDHPYVGLMVATINGSPAWRCSGTLIAPTIFVTAGHCTYGANGAQLWFRSDLEDPNPAFYGYPSTGEVSGTPHTLPGHSDATWFLYDLGVVILDSPVYPGGSPGTYAELPGLNYLDSLGKGRNNATVTAVGYGLQEFVEGPMCVGPEDCGVPPDFFDPKIRSDKTRYEADLMVVDTKGVGGLGNVTGSTDALAGSFMVSGDSKHGGTCFGDSGGPMLIGNVLVGVNSFGLNRNCAGVGGAFRVDQPASLDFINSFFP